MKVALIGFPISGKSTLLAAVSSKPAALPGSTSIIEAVVPVPDHRLDCLTDLYRPRKTTPAMIDCLDLPALNFCDEAARGPSRKLIQQARTVDLFVLVVRAFADDSVPPYRDGVDPRRDMAELAEELILTDLEFVETRIERLEKQVLKPGKTQEQDQAELVLQRRLQGVLEAGQPVAAAALGPAEKEACRVMGLLTLKPMMVVVNVGEQDLSGAFDASGAVSQSTPVIALCARLEQELSRLDSPSRAEFMNDLGIVEPAADRFVRACYQALGLISFLTVGEDEVRAWPIRRGTCALDAAGKIHTDLKRGFIRAETMPFVALQEYGSAKALRAAGKLRSEGKTYQVQDGDIIDFRFNV